MTVVNKRTPVLFCQIPQSDTLQKKKKTGLCLDEVVHLAVGRYCKCGNSQKEGIIIFASHFLFLLKIKLRNHDFLSFCTKTTCFRASRGQDLEARISLQRFQYTLMTLFCHTSYLYQKRLQLIVIRMMHLDT